MDFTAWLARHPLKSPGETDRAQYTRDVMARVRALDAAPRRRPVPWSGWTWPRLAVGLAGVAVAGLVLRASLPAGRIAAQVERDTAVLVALGEPVSDVLPEDDAAEFDVEEGLRLAEAGPDDEAWVAQTLQLLDQLDEELPEEPSGEAGTEQEWLDDLQLLDEAGSSSSS